MNSFTIQILHLRRLKALGQSSITSEQINEAEDKLKKAEKKKERLISEAKRMRKRREEEKKVIQALANKSPENAQALKHFNRGIIGRPPLEVDQPGLCSAILDIVGATSAADERRRTEGLRSITTVRELSGKLEEVGFIVSKSATYLRVLPRRANTREGRLHIHAVPVKLLRPEHSLRKAHQDRMFAKSGVDYIMTLCEIFGSQAVNVLCLDDKARVPLGLTAAKEQAPILMGIDYKVRMPDHDFVIGQGHKLIPSVYAKCDIKENGVMSYSGLTFIFIRSARHDTSNAFTHHDDIKVVLEDPSFIVQGRVKPLLFRWSNG